MKIGWLVGIMCSLVALAPAAHAADQPTTNGIAQIPVTLSVANTNTSKAPLASDGATYTVRGHLTGPASVLRSHQAPEVTVYLFGLDAGEWNWDFKAEPGYDYAEQMAKAGHVSFTFDEVGYGASGHPVDGNFTSVGAEADMAHQIIEKLRSGAYMLAGRPGVSFSRVLLAGHDVGGLVAEVEAYSYADIDGLIEVTWADQGQTQYIVQRSVTASAEWCTASPAQAQAGQPTGYVLFATEQDWHSWMFYDADPKVVQATDALRNPDPCGIIRTLAATVLWNNPYAAKSGIPGGDPGNSPVSLLAQITVPVLIVFGNNDTQLWSRQGENEQQANFSGSRDKTTMYVPNSAHFPMFERSAPQFRQIVASWLTAHGA